MFERTTSPNKRKYIGRSIVAVGAVCIAIALPQLQEDQKDIPAASISINTESFEDELLIKNMPDRQEERAMAVTEDNYEEYETGHIQSINLFGKAHNLEVFKASVVNGILDFTPPIIDGVFIVTMDDTVSPEGYSFVSNLKTHTFNVESGDLLIGGHSNSGADWIMNDIDTLKVGDVQDITFKNAIVTAKVTKLTDVGKEGEQNIVPGFIDGLGKDGAIFACLLNEAGDDQTGKVRMAGIEVIAVTYR